MLPPFRLETHFSQWEFSARYNLAASDMESMSMAELLSLGSEADLRSWGSLRLGYTRTYGDPALLEATSEWYDVVRPEDLICFSGAQEGIYCAMHSLLHRGDHAIVLVPNYQSMETIPRSICDVTGVALREDDDWRLSVDDVRRALRPTTRLIALNFPNNPTGAVPSRRTFDEIVSLASSRGFYLFVDEVYRGTERNPEHRLPHVADLYERGLSLGVTSKALGLAGLRVGWIACRDHDVLRRMEHAKHYLSIAGSAPSEVLATIALRNREAILARNRAIASGNLDCLRDFFASRPDCFEWYEPHGGSILFPRYRGAEGVGEFCRRAVEEFGVLLLPASVFASDLCPVAPDRFRIGYGRRDLPDGLAALGRMLDSPN
jgi:hypothetical protein